MMKVVYDTFVILASSKCTDFLFLSVEPKNAGSWRLPCCNEGWLIKKMPDWEMGAGFVAGALCCDLRAGHVVGAPWCNPWIGICWDVEEYTSCDSECKFKFGMATSSKSASITSTGCRLRLLPRLKNL
jgi:hypothetical protein